jgi:N-terminal half of MaoC dehydratase
MSAGNEQPGGYLTPAVRALIGAKGPVLSSVLPLDADRLRRFTQAVMEPDIPNRPDGPEYDSFATASPLWPLHAFVRRPGEPDPFDVLREAPDLDGTYGAGENGLPPVQVGLSRILNGGVSAEFFASAQLGDVVHAQSEYLDITEREGRSGAMVIIATRTTYTDQNGKLLCRVTNSIIRR